MSRDMSHLINYCSSSAELKPGRLKSSLIIFSQNTVVLLELRSRSLPHGSIVNVLNLDCKICHKNNIKTNFHVLVGSSTMDMVLHTITR